VAASRTPLTGAYASLILVAPFKILVVFVLHIVVVH
jgi:hypothetical protein